MPSSASCCSTLAGWCPPSNWWRRLAWSVATFLDRQGHWHDQAATQATALAAAQRLEDPSGQGYSHRSLAGAHTRLGRLDEAHTHYQHVLAHFQNLGDSHMAGGDAATAHRVWRQAVTIFDEPGHSDAETVRAKLSRSVVRQRSVQRL